MRFLVDNPVSPVVAEALRRNGHDAVHVLDYKLQAAADDVILARASDEDRIVVTSDTDFGLLDPPEGGTPKARQRRGQTPLNTLPNLFVKTR